MFKTGVKVKVVSPTCDLPLEQYIRWKINILENQFYIRLNYADYEHFENCKSHAAVDSYARKLFNERL